METRISLAISYDDEKMSGRAQELSEKLGFPVFKGPAPSDFSMVMGVSEGYLDIRENAKSSPSAVSVDFTKGALDFRRRYGQAGGDLLVRAVGGGQQKVLDATAGLGRDTFMLASSGCDVTALERNEVLFELLCDGVVRGRNHPSTQEICGRIKILNHDAVSFLGGDNGTGWDVIYLDPMFPVKKKSALPKREMQLLHLLVGVPKDESESRHLAERALEVCRRVVIKRPLSATPLIDLRTPSTCFKGDSIRFDVYVK